MGVCLDHQGADIIVMCMYAKFLLDSQIRCQICLCQKSTRKIVYPNHIPKNNAAMKLCVVLKVPLNPNQPTNQPTVLFQQMKMLTAVFSYLTFLVLS